MQIKNYTMSKASLNKIIMKLKFAKGKTVCAK